LEDRAAKGFTVIQAVALAELDGLNTPNPYGHRPLLDNDPTKPDVKDGPDNDYWDHVDFIVREANRRGMYIGLLPTWGDKWNKKWGVGPEIFTPQNAEAYGRWLGQRYRDAGLVWILGGDRPIENDTHREIIRAMARGLRAGDGGAHLMTFHPTGGNGSAQYFHAEDWLDFNMRQNGHNLEFTSRYDQTRKDYDRTPVKPVLDGEPVYEDHPVAFAPDKEGHSIAARRCAQAVVLEPVQRCFWPHLRPPLGLANVGSRPRADQPPPDAVVRGHPATRGGSDATRQTPAAVAPVPDPAAR